MHIKFGILTHRFAGIDSLTNFFKDISFDCCFCHMTAKMKCGAGVVLAIKLYIRTSVVIIAVEIVNREMENE